METGNSCGQTEPKPIAGHRSASLQPIEALENMLELVRGNTWSVVRNRQNRFTIFLLDANNHNATLTAVLDGIVDEIRYGVEQQIAIGADTHRPVTDYLDAPTLAFCGCVKQLCDPSRDFNEIHSAKGDLSISRLDLRDARQRRKHAQNIIEVCNRLADQRWVMICGVLIDASLLEASAHAG